MPKNRAIIPVFRHLSYKYSSIMESCFSTPRLYPVRTLPTPVGGNGRDSRWECNASIGWSLAPLEMYITPRPLRKHSHCVFIPPRSFCAISLTGRNARSNGVYCEVDSRAIALSFVPSVWFISNCDNIAFFSSWSRGTS